MTAGVDLSTIPVRSIPTYDELSYDDYLVCPRQTLILRRHTLCLSTADGLLEQSCLAKSTIHPLCQNDIFMGINPMAPPPYRQYYDWNHSHLP
jgi:hypothetical protein